MGKLEKTDATAVYQQEKVVTFVFLVSFESQAARWQHFTAVDWAGTAPQWWRQNAEAKQWRLCCRSVTSPLSVDLLESKFHLIAGEDVRSSGRRFVEAVGEVRVTFILLLLPSSTTTYCFSRAARNPVGQFSRANRSDAGFRLDILTDIHFGSSGVSSLSFTGCKQQEGG